MLDAICAEIHNYFTRESDKIIGDFAIVDGVVSPPSCLQKIQNGQYYRVIGSVFNDGIHRRGDETLTDEPVFHGAIWLMRIPKDFLDLCASIDAWQNKYGTADSVNMSPFSSESFGGYSYSKGSGGGNDGSSVPTWQSTFASQLNVYRKVKR